ncbi:hypothetical protein GCM10020254_07740 [Streptomyces goshikiensis]
MPGARGYRGSCAAARQAPLAAPPGTPAPVSPFTQPWRSPFTPRWQAAVTASVAPAPAWVAMPVQAGMSALGGGGGESRAAEREGQAGEDTGDAG